MEAFNLRPWVVRTLVAALSCLVSLRAAEAIRALLQGDETALLVLPLGVLLPGILIGGLLMMQPTRTQEGLLMRLGTAVHLLLIIAIPPLALHLALGLPVVFLLIEVFETRLPTAIRDPVVRGVMG
jgi:hypothetical protein